MPQPYPARVPLPLAAQRLRRSRERVLRMVLVGDLQGVQENGRWFVDADSVDRFLEADTLAPSAA